MPRALATAGYRSAEQSSVRLGWLLALALACIQSACSASITSGPQGGQHDAAVLVDAANVGSPSDAGSKHDASSSAMDAASSVADDSGLSQDAAARDAAVSTPIEIAYTSSGAARGAGADKGALTIGHQFKVTQSGIRLRELGVWDEGENGLSHAHTLTLFALDQLGQNAVATPVAGGSVVVPAGTAAALQDGFRFAALPAPVPLAIGTYAVIAYDMDANDPYGDGGNLPCTSTGIEHGSFVPYQFSALSSPMFPVGGDTGMTASASFRYETSSGPVLRILPMGDSITWGVGGSNAGYRAKLAMQLTAAGRRFQFVGTSAENAGKLPSDQTRHEGHSGWVISAGSSGRQGLAESVATWLGPNGVHPDVILLMIGTNDVDINYDFGNVGTRLGAFISKLVDKSSGLAPKARVVVAKLVPINDPNKDMRVRSYNDIVAQVVAQHHALGEDVRVVDMHSAVTTADLSDALHPNDTGYAKMAQVWFDAVMAP